MSTGSTHARTHARNQAVTDIRQEYQGLAAAIEADNQRAIGAGLERLDQAITRLETIESQDGGQDG